VAREWDKVVMLLCFRPAGNRWAHRAVRKSSILAPNEANEVNVGRRRGRKTNIGGEPPWPSIWAIGNTGPELTIRPTSGHCSDVVMRQSPPLEGVRDGGESRD